MSVWFKLVIQLDWWEGTRWALLGLEPGSKLESGSDRLICLLWISCSVLPNQAAEWCHSGAHIPETSGRVQSKGAEQSKGWGRKGEKPLSLLQEARAVSPWLCRGGVEGAINTASGGNRTPLFPKCPIGVPAGGIKASLFQAPIHTPHRDARPGTSHWDSVSLTLPWCWRQTLPGAWWIRLLGMRLWCPATAAPSQMQGCDREGPASPMLKPSCLRESLLKFIHNEESQGSVHPDNHSCVPSYPFVNAFYIRGTMNFLYIVSCVETSFMC